MDEMAIFVIVSQEVLGNHGKNAKVVLFFNNVAGKVIAVRLLHEGPSQKPYE